MITTINEFNSNINFNLILKRYCGPIAKAIDLIQEQDYKGYKIWSFKRKIKSLRFKDQNGTKYKNYPVSLKDDVAEEDKEIYYDEFYMCLSDFPLEFDTDDIITVLRSDTRENAINKIHYYIDANINNTENVYENGFNQKEYLKWKRANVSYRGMKSVGEPNGVHGRFGDGLYTAALSNKSYAKGYGELRFVVNARPKNPKKVQGYNYAEIFIQNLISNYNKAHNIERHSDFYNHSTIAKEMLNIGFDGLEILGAEYVNYTPDMDKVKYYKTEEELKWHFENYVQENINENIEEEEQLQKDWLPAYLYHISPVENKQSILNNGIKLSTGGTTFLKRTYTPRIYLATSLIAAYDLYVNFHAHNQKKYLIYKIDTSKINGNFFDDDKFIHGVYTDENINKKAIIELIDPLSLSYDDDELEDLYNQTWHDYTNENMFTNFINRFRKPKEKRYTPDPIDPKDMGPNDIFVFGSNTEGAHGGGAAKAAVNYYGAIWGQARGLQGNSYGIVTLDYTGKEPVTLSTIGHELDTLIAFAKQNKQFTFWMTKIGTGISKIPFNDIVNLFNERERYWPENIILPKEFTIEIKGLIL